MPETFMGWFFGFKLHLICNEKGELLNFVFTPGDVDDRKPLEYESFISQIYGKLVGDKGYISNELFSKLFVDGIQLITKLKSNIAEKPEKLVWELDRQEARLSERSEFRASGPAPTQAGFGEYSPRPARHRWKTFNRNLTILFDNQRGRTTSNNL